MIFDIITDTNFAYELELIGSNSRTITFESPIYGFLYKVNRKTGKVILVNGERKIDFGITKERCLEIILKNI